MTKICLIGVDGLRLPLGLEHSATLRRLAADGACASIVMEPPTWSGPGWSSLLTGSTQAEHRVLDNSFAGQQLPRHPDLLSRAYYRNQQLTTFAAAGWPPLVDPAGVGPVIQFRAEQQLAGQHRVIVRDGETYGYRVIDQEIVAWSRVALGLGVDVSFVYLCGVDEAGHLHGALGPEYAAAIERVDAQLQQLVEVVETRSREQAEDWLVVVATDHGHRDEGGHGGDSEVERASFAIARRFGPEPLQWPSEIAPHELVDTLLAFLPPS